MYRAFILAFILYFPMIGMHIPAPSFIYRLCGICKEYDIDVPITWPFAYDGTYAHRKCVKLILPEAKALVELLKKRCKSADVKNELFERHRLIIRTTQAIIGQTKTIKQFVEEPDGSKRLGSIFAQTVAALDWLKINDHFNDPHNIEQAVIVTAAYFSFQMAKAQSKL